MGPNGVGKTTLMRVILGLEEPSAGMVQIARGMRMGYLPQNAVLDSTRTVWEECLSLFSDLIAMQERLAQLERAMGEGKSEE